MFSKSDLEKIFEIVETCKRNLQNQSKNEEIKKLIETKFLENTSDFPIVDLSNKSILAEDGSIIDGQIECYFYSFSRASVLTNKGSIFQDQAFILLPFFDERIFSSKLIGELTMKSQEYFLLNRAIEIEKPDIIFLDGSFLRDIFRLKEIIKNKKIEQEILNIDIELKTRVSEIYSSLLKENKLNEFPIYLSKYYYFQLLKLLENAAKKDIALLFFAKRPIGSTTLKENIEKIEGISLKLRDLEILFAFFKNQSFFTKPLYPSTKIERKEKIFSIILNSFRDTLDIEAIKEKLFIEGNIINCYSFYYKKDIGSKIYKIEVPMIKKEELEYYKSLTMTITHDLSISNHEGFPKLLEYAHHEACIPSGLKEQIEVIIWKLLR